MTKIEDFFSGNNEIKTLEFVQRTLEAFNAYKHTNVKIVYYSDKRRTRCYLDGVPNFGFTNPTPATSFSFIFYDLIDKERCSSFKHMIEEHFDKRSCGEDCGIRRDYENFRERCEQESREFMKDPGCCLN